MAKRINELQPGMSMPPIVRMFGQPLDNTSLFQTRQEMLEYASSSPLAYEGQILICYNTDSTREVQLYVIGPSGAELLYPRPVQEGSASMSGITKEFITIQPNGIFPLDVTDPMPLALTINGIAYTFSEVSSEDDQANGVRVFALDDSDVRSWVGDDDEVILYSQV